MKKIVSILFAFILFSLFAEIHISDVKVFSGFPWQEVVIGYTITGTTNIPVCVTLSATDRLNDNQTYKAKENSLVGAETTPGCHVMRWNASADGVKFKSDQVIFTVCVEDPLYYVIDLSGGVNATSYPVTGMNAIPNGRWTDEYKTTKLVLRRIEAGSFIRGSDQANEAHRVTLTHPFYIGVFEVTQKQWELVKGTSPSRGYYGKGKGNTYPVYDVSYDMIRGASKGAKWPNSSEVDGTSFIGILQTKTGLSFDLPTVAQWEYSCRAGSVTKYYWGDSGSDDFAWHYGNSEVKAMGFLLQVPHPVGTKKPNDWGLYDMSGNAEEWCLDWASRDNIYGVDPKGEPSGSYRVLRGGSAKTDISNCESGATNGHWAPSSTGTSDGSANSQAYFGFRISKSLP